MIPPEQLPRPLQIAPPSRRERWVDSAGVTMALVLALLLGGVTAGLLWGREPLPAPEPYDAYAMQAGLLSSVVPVALATVVARDGEAIYAATNVAYVENRMGAVATEVRRDSLNNVDRLSTRVAVLDLKLDNHVRLDHPTPYAGVAVAPPDGLPPYLGPRGER